VYEVATANQRRLTVLAELSQLGLTLARDLQGRVLAVGNAAEACDLGLAFQRTARAVRQAVALEARLERDAARLREDDRKAAAEQAADRVEHRKSQARAAIERAARADYSENEVEDLLDDLDMRLEEAALLDDGFAEIPVEALITRLQAELGMGGEGDAGRPPPAEDPEMGAREPRTVDPPPLSRAQAGDLELRIARETYEPYAAFDST